MNENDFSMFSEFKEVAETIKNNKDKNESSLPAMIILEKNGVRINMLCVVG